MGQGNVEQADGRSKGRSGGYHQLLKKWKHRAERRRAKIKPEEPTYGKYKGYET